MENIFYLWGLAVSLKILWPEVAAAPVPYMLKTYGDLTVCSPPKVFLSIS
ncbi:hypothetical protein AB1L05_11800 [Cytobacillus horneckiae]|nr:hypothetical protein [Cytobacillus horneckiae]MCM3178014.1 hypothetical protein [Cytobacillus horneckiae]